jgi:uncharacterized membrane protein YfcA
MQDFIILGGAALIASLMTFFSGFGLGTILTPVFALFFPVSIAIAVTAVVHLLNNIFKLLLLRKDIDWGIVLRFGITAIVGAALGATLLNSLEAEGTLTKYTLGDAEFEITAMNLVIAVLMITFALMEIIPRFKLKFEKKHLIPGGALSGFFGGLSGHQGALRTSFLIKFNLTKERFIATGVVIACFIDFTRIPFYYKNLEDFNMAEHYDYIVVATLCAFVGAIAGRFLLKKVTIESVHVFVSIAIIMFSLALGLGFLH